MVPEPGINPVDFHCHLDLCGDMEQAFSACDKMRCITLTVTTTPKAFERNRIMAGHTSHVHAALGLHPQLVAKRASEITLFEELAKTTRFIGEIGLDAGRRFYPSFDRQKEVFERAMSVCGKLGDKIISLHSVRTAKLVLDSVERTSVHQTCRPVLHWFNASNSEIRRALDLGCFFSVNEQMLLTPRGKALLLIVPLSRLLTETDAPFQSPNGEERLPGSVEGVIDQIADAYRKDVGLVKRQIMETAKTLVES